MTLSKRGDAIPISPLAGEPMKKRLRGEEKSKDKDEKDEGAGKESTEEREEKEEEDRR